MIWFPGIQVGDFCRPDNSLSIQMVIEVRGSWHCLQIVWALGEWNAGVWLAGPGLLVRLKVKIIKVRIKNKASMEN